MRRCCNYLQRRVHNRSPDRHKASGRLGLRSEWQVLISGVVRAAIANDRTRWRIQLVNATVWLNSQPASGNRGSFSAFHSIVSPMR